MLFNDPKITLAGLNGLERSISEYLTFLQQLEIKNSQPEETQTLKETLKQASEPLQKKLKVIQTEITELQKKTNQIATEHDFVQPIHFSNLPENVTIKPQVSSDFFELFPELYNQKINCTFSENNHNRLCLIFAPSIEAVKLLIYQIQYQNFDAGEITYLRSYEAFKNQRFTEGFYLLELAQKQNSQKKEYPYQYGRMLMKFGQIKNGLQALRQAYFSGLDLPELNYLHILDGYLQENCHKALAFAESANSSALKWLAPIISECYARIGDFQTALKVLQEGHEIQKARIFEEYLNSFSEALAAYTRAQVNASDSTKAWLDRKVQFCQTQVKNQKAERISSSEVKQ